MKYFWEGFQKQAGIGAAVMRGGRDALAAGVKATRSLGAGLANQGNKLTGGVASSALKGNVGGAMRTAGNFVRSNPKAALGTAAAVGLGAGAGLAARKPAPQQGGNMGNGY